MCTRNDCRFCKNDGKSKICFCNNDLSPYYRKFCINVLICEHKQPDELKTNICDGCRFYERDIEPRFRYCNNDMSPHFRYFCNSVTTCEHKQPEELKGYEMEYTIEELIDRKITQSKENAQLHVEKLLGASVIERQSLRLINAAAKLMAAQAVLAFAEDLKKAITRQKNIPIVGTAGVLRFGPWHIELLTCSKPKTVIIGPFTFTLEFIEQLDLLRDTYRKCVGSYVTWRIPNTDYSVIANFSYLTLCHEGVDESVNIPWTDIDNIRNYLNG